MYLCRIKIIASLRLLSVLSESSGLGALKEHLPNTSQFFNWSEFNHPHEIQVKYGHPTASVRHLQVSLVSVPLFFVFRVWRKIMKFC